MDVDTLIQHTKRLIQKSRNPNTIEGVYSEIAQFLRTYAGAKSEFFASIKDYNPRNYSNDYAAQQITGVLSSFKDYVEAGLLEDVSPTRKAQIDVVSDFLEQAHALLESSEVHPVAPVVLIGASWNSGDTLLNYQPVSDQASLRISIVSPN